MKHKNLTTIFAQAAGMLTSATTVKRTALILLAVMLTLGTQTAWADHNGNCGTSGHESEVTWTYVSSTHTLTISGTGAMADYTDYDNQPWKDYRGVIESIIIENGVTRIGNRAFGEFTALKRLSIGSGVTSIGDYALGGRATLEAITVAAGNTVYDSRNNCNAIIYKAHGSEPDKLQFGCKNSTIPDGVVWIGDAFRGCTGLKNITIPASVTWIYNYAFYNCTSLESVTFDGTPELNKIGQRAFEGCTSLTSFVIPANVGEIEAYAFNGCTSLASVLVLPTTPPKLEGDFETTIFQNNAANRIFYCHGNNYTSNTKWNTITSGSLTTVWALTFNSNSSGGFTASPDTSLKCGGVGYYTEGTVITLFPTIPEGYYFNSYEVSGGTVSGNATDGFTLTMPANDVTVTAIIYQWPGSGNSEEDPFMISTTFQLNKLAELVNSGTGFDDKYFKLMNDLTYTYTTAWDDAASTENNYTAIGSITAFKGKFDGDGHTISGIRIYSNDTNDQGLFGNIYNSAKINNVTLADARITCSGNVAGIVGSGNGTINNCHTTSNVTITSNGYQYSSGGIVGNGNDISFNNCTSAATIVINIENSNCGGIVGMTMLGNIYNCTSTGTIIIAAGNCQNIGGIIGMTMLGDISNCTSTSTIIIAEGNCQNIGGIVGYNCFGIYNCTSSTTIILESGVTYCQNFGGIAGFSDSGNFSGNHVIGANIPPVTYSGAIVGGCYDSLLNGNTYHSCLVGDNAFNIGVGSYNKGEIFKGDVNGEDGCATLDDMKLFLDGDYDQTALIAAYADPEHHTAYNGTVPDLSDLYVTFTRSFTKDKASTICLPFDYTPATGIGTFYEFVGVNAEKTEVTMQAANTVTSSLSANTPYLFKPAATGPVLFHGPAAASIAPVDQTPNTTQYPDAADWAFKGTYARIKWTHDTTDPEYTTAREAEIGSIYGFAAPGKADLAEGKFFRVKGGSNSYVLPFRAYLQYSGTSGARAVTRGGTEDLPETMTVRFIDAVGTPTAIGTLNTRTGEVTFDGDAWYSLDGRRIQGQPTQKGVYINNGKKIVIK